MFSNGVTTEVGENNIHFCGALLYGGECIQDMVVRFRGIANPVHGECLRERRSSMRHGAVLMGVSHHSDIPRVRSVPFDLPPPDPTVEGLRYSVPRGH